MTYHEICQAVAESLDRRDSRRDLLAERIRRMLDRALRASRKPELECGEAGVVNYTRCQARCSQGGPGSGWPIYDHEEEHLLLHVPSDPVARSFGALDLTYHDGHNTQHQIRGPWTADGAPIRPATVAQLRILARLLPEALARLLTGARDQAEAEAREADSSIASLADVEEVQP